MAGSDRHRAAGWIAIVPIILEYYALEHCARFHCARRPLSAGNARARGDDGGDDRGVPDKKNCTMSENSVENENGETSIFQ